MKNTVWCGVTSQMCDIVLLVRCTNVPEYSPTVKRTFAINSVIVVAITHILSAIYCKNNDCSGGTCECNGGILIKIHTFTGNTPAQK